jgi:hypothetical protein
LQSHSAVQTSVYGENVNSIPILEDAERYSFDSKTYENGIPESLPIDHSPYGSSKLATHIYYYAHIRVEDRRIPDELYLR